MKKIILTAAMLGAVAMSATSASANTGAATAFDAHYLNNSNCATCHTSTFTPATTLTAIGTAWKVNGGTKDAGPTTQAQWDTLDGDAAITTAGFTKDPSWTLPAATTTPVETSDGGGGGCITSSVTTPLMMVLAMLSLGFFVRRKKS